MRSLLSPGQISTGSGGSTGNPDNTDGDIVDLRSFYATDWVPDGGVRANFVSSVDGAVSVGGLSGGLQTSGDNRVFAALRDLADVVLVGSGTVSAEKYRPVRPDAERIAVRSKHGLPSSLPIAVVSRSLSLDPSAEIFSAADGGARTIVLTCSDGGTARRRRELGAVADVIDCGTENLDLGVARAALAERGLHRVLCEGGPSLFSQLAAVDLIDELCLSFSPILAGPGAGRITSGDPWPRQGRAMTLYSVLEEAGALFLRYRR